MGTRSSFSKARSRDLLGDWPACVNFSPGPFTPEMGFPAGESQGAVRGGGRTAQPSAAPPPPLLHQNSNNSPELKVPQGYKLRQKVTVLTGPVAMANPETRVAESGEGMDRDGRCWKLGEDGLTWRRTYGGITSSEAKRAFQLRRNVEAFAAHYRHENCAFLTLTAADAEMTPKQFGEIWNDMTRHKKGGGALAWLKSYVRVLEAQRRGAPHYHLLVATPWDLQPARFDWAALNAASECRKRGDLLKARACTKLYSSSATQELRMVWSELREVCKRYGLGRSECLPFRKEAGAVANYVGKYLEGGLAFRRDSWKGARRVEYDRKESINWRACGARFGWRSPGAKAWRQRVGELAVAIGATDSESMVAILGRRWAYNARPAIVTTGEEEWRDVLMAYARAYGGRVDAKPKLTAGGVVELWWPSSEAAASEADAKRAAESGDGETSNPLDPF